MSTLRRITLGRLNGVLARATLGRLGDAVVVEDGGGGSGVGRLARSGHEAGWTAVRRSPNVIAALHRAAVQAQINAAPEIEETPLEPTPTAPAKRSVQTVARPTDAQIRAFVGAIKTEIGAEAVEALPLPADVLALEFLNGDWLEPVSTDLAAKRRDDDAIAILLLSL